MGEILFLGLVCAAFYSIAKYNPYIRVGTKAKKPRGYKRASGRR